MLLNCVVTGFPVLRNVGHQTTVKSGEPEGAVAAFGAKSFPVLRREHKPALGVQAAGKAFFEEFVHRLTTFLLLFTTFFHLCPKAPRVSSGLCHHTDGLPRQAKYLDNGGKSGNSSVNGTFYAEQSRQNAACRPVAFNHKEHATPKAWGLRQHRCYGAMAWPAPSGFSKACSGTNHENQDRRHHWPRLQQQ